MSEVAKEILDKYWDLLLPVKVDDLACRCGIYIKPLNEHLSKRYSGKATLENESGKKIIYYNPTESEIRQRFTLAHELGHHLLGHTRYKNEFRDDLVLFNVSIEAIHWKLINLGIIDSN